MMENIKIEDTRKELFVVYSVGDISPKLYEVKNPNNYRYLRFGIMGTAIGCDNLNDPDSWENLETVEMKS